MRDDEPLLSEAEIKALLGDGEPAPALPGAGLHVLVVDDDAATRALLGEVLAGLGAEATLAGDALEALEMVAADPTVNVLLTDLRMPGPGGGELCDAVSRIPGRRIARLVTSGGGTLDDALTAFENGVRDFLPKPVDPERLGLALTRCSEAIRRG